jgi:hypothetical protein
MPKVIPVPGALSKPFWDAVNEKRLVLQHCAACDRLQYLKRPTIRIAWAHKQAAIEPTCPANTRHLTPTSSAEGPTWSANSPQTGSLAHMVCKQRSELENQLFGGPRGGWWAERRTQALGGGRVARGVWNPCRSSQTCGTPPGALGAGRGGQGVSRYLHRTPHWSARATAQAFYPGGSRSSCGPPLTATV